jgi:FkbM family methyltransferase
MAGTDRRRRLLETVRDQFDPAAWAFDSTHERNGGGVKHAVKTAAFRVGAGPALRRLRQTVEPAAAKRERRESEHLHLLLAFTLAADSNCIDVGASVGDTLEDLVRFAPGGRHIAYEPIPRFAAELAERFPQVDVRNAAVAEAPGETSFVYVKSRAAYSGLRERDYPGDETIEHITVKVESLDTALPADYVPGLIKIDVEGAERQVIEGAVGVIARHRPVVIFEHSRGAAEHYDTTPGAIHDLLTGECGLRIMDLDGGGPYSRGDLERSFAAEERWNYVARP